MSNQHDNNNSNNVFHLRDDITTSFILRANSRPQGVGCRRRIITQSWQKNTGSSSSSTVHLPPTLNTQ